MAVNPAMIIVGSHFLSSLVATPTAMNPMRIAATTATPNAETCSLALAMAMP